MQPLDNKYSKWYGQLIEKRKKYPLSKGEGYCENHHAIPECLGGKNTKENMVFLTAREHFVAHLLLTKMYVGRAKKKMHFAFHAMRRKKAGMQRYEPNSHIYEILVKLIDRKPSEETRKKMRESAKTRPVVSDYTKKLLSEKVMASYTPELRARRAKTFSERVITGEMREAQSKMRKKLAHIPEEKRQLFREKLSQRQRENRGEKSPRSKTWTLMSPVGEIYVTRAMNDFCTQHGLSYSAFRNRSHENNTTPIDKGPSKGWSLLKCA